MTSWLCLTSDSEANRTDIAQIGRHIKNEAHTIHGVAVVEIGYSWNCMRQYNDASEAVSMYRKIHYVGFVRYSFVE